MYYIYSYCILLYTEKIYGLNNHLKLNQLQLYGYFKITRSVRQFDHMITRNFYTNNIANSVLIRVLFKF